METPEIRDAEIVAPQKGEETERRSPTMRHAIAFLLGIGVAVGGHALYERLYGDVAAIVDGTRISNAELSESVALVTQSASLQGIDVADPEVAQNIRAQALEGLISNAILMNAVERAGITANDEAVKEAYDGFVAQSGGADALKERMASVGVSEDMLMENITDRIKVDALLEKETDIETVTVSEEEMRAYLDSFTENGMMLPPFDEIKTEVEATLKTQKQQALVDEFIEKLRSEAKIKILND